METEVMRHVVCDLTCYGCLFFFQAEDGIRDYDVTGVQTCALPISVELMNVGWNFRREHLQPLQRSHYVISNGGDQPNVVPSYASVWYFIREITAEGIRTNWDTLQRIAEGAAMMTDTTVSRRVVGAAWPRHFNKPIALAMDENIRAVGLPTWSEDDQRFAKALQIGRAHVCTPVPS